MIYVLSRSDRGAIMKRRCDERQRNGPREGRRKQADQAQWPVDSVRYSCAVGGPCPSVLGGRNRSGTFGPSEAKSGHFGSLTELHRHGALRVSLVEGCACPVDQDLDFFSGLGFVGRPHRRQRAGVPGLWRQGDLWSVARLGGDHRQRNRVGRHRVCYSPFPCKTPGRGGCPAHLRDLGTMTRAVVFRFDQCQPVASR